MDLAGRARTSTRRGPVGFWFLDGTGTIPWPGRKKSSSCFSTRGPRTCEQNHLNHIYQSKGFASPFLMVLRPAAILSERDSARSPCGKIKRSNLTEIGENQSDIDFLAVLRTEDTRWMTFRSVVMLS